LAGNISKAKGSEWIKYPWSYGAEDTRNDDDGHWDQTFHQCRCQNQWNCAHNEQAKVHNIHSRMYQGMCGGTKHIKKQKTTMESQRRQPVVAAGGVIVAITRGNLLGY
jgi:hypothetical protein